MIRVLAPAKVNLFLAVKGRRPDGSHELETIFQAIDLADVIELELLPSEIRLTSDRPGLPAGEGNLCWRAAALLREKAGTQKGATIRLRKEIPVGAGLGGGSSDAAAALVGLNRLWELDLATEDLQDCAAQLGADVPFFLQGGTALGKGRGEVLSPLPTPDLRLVVAWPKTTLSTALVYQAWDEQPGQGAVSLEEMLEAVQKNDPAQIAASLRNDLEAAAMRLCPACAAVKEDLLRAGGLGALVSGSGSAVFGIARDERHADEMAASISAREDLWIRKAKSLRSGEAS